MGRIPISVQVVWRVVGEYENVCVSYYFCETIDRVW